jgi:hypothetical protein
MKKDGKCKREREMERIKEREAGRNTKWRKEGRNKRN